MRGAPWDGLYYGFVLLAVVGLGALIMAFGTQDFLTRTIAWLVVAGAVVLGVRIVRRVLRAPRSDDRPTGRWWFNG